MLLEMQSAVNRVVAVTEEYYKYGNILLDNFIDACAHCMGVLCSLWRELADFVDANIRKRKWNTLPYNVMCVPSRQVTHAGIGLTSISILLPFSTWRNTERGGGRGLTYTCSYRWKRNSQF
jgi:hypothetical protein